jgi:sulfotransferase family protein
MPDSIVSIESVAQSLDPNALIAESGLEFPTSGWEDATYSFPVQGWIVGKQHAATSVSVSDEYGPRLTMPVGVARPDVVESEGRSGWPPNCGFASRVNTIELPRKFRVWLVARFEGAGPARLAVIEGTRSALPEQTGARFQPIMMTTLGRSGSTWLMSLLGQHPEITAFQAQTSEPRAASYFADVLRTLSRPSSYVSMLRGYVVSGLDWTGASPVRPLHEYERDADLREWLGKAYVEDLIAFVAQRLDALYTQLSAKERKEGATRFVEKCPPNGPQIMLSEIYPKAREVLLVRDFRDYVCSVRSWRHGWEESRSRYSSDAEWVRQSLARQVRAVSVYRRYRPNAMVLRYEDLVTRTEETLDSLFAYLGVESGPATVNSVLDQTEASSNQSIMRDHQTSGGPAESIGRWKRDLEPSLQKVCEEAFGATLAEFGYA